MIVAVTGLKGGTGKSTIALHLAGEAQRRGLKTLVADADAQRTSLTWSDLASENGISSSPTVIGVSTGLHKQLPELAAQYGFTVVDCAPRSDVTTRAALCIADVALIPTGPSPTDVWALSDT